MALSFNLASAFGGIGRALANPVYRLYWTGNTINTVGRWLYRVAVGWLTWELTESTSWLGIIAFADTFPMVIFSVIAGAVADRFGYMRIIVGAQLATGLVAALFAALTLMGAITIELVLVLTLLIGSLEALTTPARMSLVHSLVPKQDLSAAIALGSATFNAARLVGPAIAGLLILWVSLGTVIALGAASFLQFVVVLLYLRVEEQRGVPKPSRGLLSDIWQGVQYALHHRGIRFLLLLLGATGLFIRPLIDMLPGFADQVFGRGADGFAMLMSSIGLGAMISGLWLAQRGRTDGLTGLVVTSLLIQGLSLFLFTVTGFIWLGAVCLASFGFFMLLGGIGSQTLIQNAVDSSMRARMMSLFVVISWGLPAFGALAMGWIASYAGLPIAIGGGAIVAILIWIWARPTGRVLAPALEASEPTIDERPAARPAG